MFQKKAFALLVFLFSFSLFSFAQELKGKVSDATTGEPLAGAIVALQQGSKKLTTIVNLDGSYHFKNLVAGTYQIKITSLGYQQSLEQSVLIAEKAIVLNIQLTNASTDLGSVSVRSTNRTTDAGVRTLEKKADNVMNVLSERAIQLSPDITVANSLQRVSGVTIERSSSGEGRYAIIRGMDQRYNSTLVNGIKIPSPDNKFRYVPLDMFPADMLERLEVSKSLTPDMEGDAIGGTMNLVMKNAPAKFTLNAFAAGGTNTLFGSDRPFLQFDHSVINKKDPSTVNGASYVAKYSDFSKANLAFTNKNNPINSQLGLTIGNRFLNKRLGVILGLSYQDMYRGSDNIFNRQNPQPQVILNLNGQRYDNYPAFNDGYLRKYSTRQKRFGLNNKWDYAINERNKLSLYTLYIHMDELQSRFTIDSSLTTQRTGPESGNVATLYRSRWQIQNIYNNTLQGDHMIGSAWKFNWSAVYSIAKQNVPDQAEFEINNEAKNGVLQDPKDRLASMSRVWSNNTDKDLAGYLNLAYATKIVGRAAEFKVGGLYRHKTRENYYNNYELRGDLNGAQQFTNIYDAKFEFRDPANAKGNPKSANVYSSQEDISAGYLQGKVMLTDKLQLMGGVRVEHTKQAYQTALDSTFDFAYGKFWYTDVLPSVHLKYSPTTKQNVRLSYFRSLSRPGFFEVTPYNLPDEYYNSMGNVNLNHTTADNLDFRYEYFPSATDQILAGVFYKKIYSPVEYGLPARQIPNTAPTLSPYNFGDATNFGFELVYAKYLGMFGINLNYTFTHSNITTTKLYKYYNDATGKDTTGSVEQKRPLQGQANHTGNIALLYKNPKIGLDIQAAFVYTGERITQVSPYANLDVWQKPYSQLDISIEKRILKKLYLYAKVNNLTNSKTKLVIKQPYILEGTSGALAGQEDKSNIFVQQDIYKTSMLFGARFKF